MKKKELYESIMEGVSAEVRHALNELSDDLLQRAYDAGMGKDSAMERRRAKRFLAWKNSEKRQSLMTDPYVQRDGEDPEEFLQRCWDQAGKDFDARRFERLTKVEKPQTKLELQALLAKMLRIQAIAERYGRGQMVDLNKIDVSAVTDMSGLFRDVPGADEVKTLRINGWDVSAVTDMSHMFAGCKSLTHVSLRNWDFGCVTTMKGMFQRCESLDNITMHGWNVDRVEDMSHMFAGCRSLGIVKAQQLNTQSLKTVSHMFMGCGSLMLAGLYNWCTRYIEDASYMFYNCGQLRRVAMGVWDLPSAKTIEGMFGMTEQLSTVALFDNEMEIGRETQTGGYDYASGPGVKRIKLVIADDYADGESKYQILEDGSVVDDEGHVWTADPHLMGTKGNPIGERVANAIRGRKRRHAGDIQLYASQEEALQAAWRKDPNMSPNEIMAIYVVITHQRKLSEYFPPLFYIGNDVQTGFYEARVAYAALMRESSDWNDMLDLYNMELEEHGQKTIKPGELNSHINASRAYSRTKSGKQRANAFTRMFGK